MKDSSIEWCEHTFNPWIGCTKVSEGCKNCYAEAINSRFKGDNWGKGASRRRTSAASWKQPLRWDRYLMCSHCNQAIPRAGIPAIGNAGNREGDTCPVCYDADSVLRRPRVFCASMADWLDDEVPIEWLADLLDLIRQTPNLDWQLLTKRAKDWRGRIMDVQASLSENRRALHDWIGDWRLSREPGGPNPPFNIWIGTSVENQEQANKRIPELLNIPAVVRFLSCEPLLGPIWFRDVPGFNKVGSAGQDIVRNLWIICGGESGPKARPMHPDWARSLRDQCAAAGVPFFFKQWGEWVPAGHHPFPANELPGDKCEILNRRGECCPESDLCNGEEFVFRVGKKRAGRLLDGVEHSEFPMEGGAA